MDSVFLTDALQRKTLAATRSLGAKNIKVFTAEETRLTPAGFSKYCHRSLAYPNPTAHPDAFYAWLLHTLDQNQCRVLFPMDDAVMEIVMAHKLELSQKCILPIPSKESYEIASDKGKTAMLAIESGIDCPKTILVTHLDDLEDIICNLHFPIVIKPRKSSGSRGIRIIYNKESCLTTYLSVHKEYPFPIIQEYVEVGERYDVCLLYNNNHELRASFVQKELRHFPIDIGPSTVQESILFPELIDIAVCFMKKLEWFGVVELEFMRNPKDGKLKLMEINPRFWNSVHCSILSGINFPWLLYRVATEDDIEEFFSYTPGIRCCWLLPGDILHFIFNKKRFQMTPHFLSGKKNQVYDDILSLSDPFPVFGFILAIIRYLPSLAMWKHIFKR